MDHQSHFPPVQIHFSSRRTSPSFKLTPFAGFRSSAVVPALSDSLEKKQALRQRLMLLQMKTQKMKGKKCITQFNQAFNVL